MAITQAGVPLDRNTPSSSRPPEDDPVQTLEGIGRDTVLARVAADKTRWCRCCDVTAAPAKTSAYCPDHLKKRNLILKRLRRRAHREAVEAAAAAARSAAPAIPQGMVLVEREALVLIANMAAQMSTHVARASQHYHALRNAMGVIRSGSTT